MSISSPVAPPSRRRGVHNCAPANRRRANLTVGGNPMPRVPLQLRLTSVVPVAAVALILAACSDTATAPTSHLTPQAASDSRSPELNNEHGHMFRTREWFANDDAKTGASRHNSGSGIYYHGGPVLLSHTNVAAVYWASAPIFVGAPAVGTHGSASADASLIAFFLNHIGGSPYFNINHSYTNGTTAITNAVSYTQFWANGTSAPSGTQSVSDAQMIAMLQSGFDSGALTYDASTLYAIFTAGKVNLGGGFGTQYCAYHTHGTVTVGGVAKTVLYAAMPYNYAYPSACTSGFNPANGSADPGADYEVNTLVHETEETTTDMMGTAWYDNRGYENADKCAWTWGSTYGTGSGGTANVNLGGKDFLIQQNWVNAGSGGCALKF
jgi:hypothetical protein